jgi:hypothetical protein
MPITVRFVGSGDSFGSGGRFQTCIVVDGPRSRFAIDFGASSLIALAQQGIASTTRSTRSCSPTCTATTAAACRFC